MKAYSKLMLLMCLIVVSFFIFKKDIQESTIHKMMQNDFQIEANFSGCFGGGTQVAYVYKKNGKRWLKFISDASINNSEFRVTEFTTEKEKELESLVVEIVKANGEGGCTNYYDYKFENSAFCFRFFTSSCKIENLLH